MSSGTDAFSGSGDHLIKCVSNNTVLLAGCCILLQLLLLDLIVFLDVDSAECPRSDAPNIPKGSTIHVQMNVNNCSPGVIFKKRFGTAFFAVFQQLLKQFLFLKLEYLGQICTKNFK